MSDIMNCDNCGTQEFYLEVQTNLEKSEGGTIMIHTYIDVVCDNCGLQKCVYTPDDHTFFIKNHNEEV